MTSHANAGRRRGACWGPAVGRGTEPACRASPQAGSELPRVQQGKATSGGAEGASMTGWEAAGKRCVVVAGVTPGTNCGVSAAAGIRPGQPQA